MLFKRNKSARNAAEIEAAKVEDRINGSYVDTYPQADASIAQNQSFAANQYYYGVDPIPVPVYAEVQGNAVTTQTQSLSATQYPSAVEPAHAPVYTDNGMLEPKSKSSSPKKRKGQGFSEFIAATGSILEMVAKMTE